MNIRFYKVESIIVADKREGEEYVTNEHQPLFIFYEQGMTILDREIDLLYQRMNFFLTGISFLVAALATMLALKRSLIIPIYTVTSLGLIISFLFTVANSLSGRELNLDNLFGGPNNDMRSIELLRNAKGLDRLFDIGMHRHPASITLLVPELFIGFWSVMLVYLATTSYRWVWMLCIGIVVLLLLFIVIHQKWHPWNAKKSWLQLVCSRCHWPKFQN